jgi:hypothetical protein
VSLDNAGTSVVRNYLFDYRHRMNRNSKNERKEILDFLKVLTIVFVALVVMGIALGYVASGLTKPTLN